MTGPTLHERFPAAHDWVTIEVDSADHASHMVCKACGCEMITPDRYVGNVIVVPPCRASAKVEITSATDAARDLLTKKEGP
ncbi:MAG: hypothetical protein IVW52_05105 [Acidimicrobiales bacterium]|nr:hypothetical protein [Acidimicrobiales bacterium]